MTDTTQVAKRVFVPFLSTISLVSNQLSIFSGKSAVLLLHQRSVKGQTTEVSGKKETSPTPGRIPLDHAACALPLYYNAPAGETIVTQHPDNTELNNWEDVTFP